MPSPSDGAPFEIGVETNRIDRSRDGLSALGTFLWKFQGTTSGIENEADGATTNRSGNRLPGARADIETTSRFHLDVSGLVRAEFDHLDLTEGDVT